MRARFQLPIGAIVHPLANPQDLPVIGLDAGGIVRCRRCRTYINPFVTWSDNGRWGWRVPVSFWQISSHPHVRTCTCGALEPRCLLMN